MEPTLRGSMCEQQSRVRSIAYILLMPMHASLSLEAAQHNPAAGAGGVCVVVRLSPPVLCIRLHRPRGSGDDPGPAGCAWLWHEFAVLGACMAAVLVGGMRLSRCPLDGAWCLVCELCQLAAWGSPHAPLRPLRPFHPRPPLALNLLPWTLSFPIDRKRCRCPCELTAYGGLRESRCIHTLGGL